MEARRRSLAARICAGHLTGLALLALCDPASAELRLDDYAGHWRTDLGSVVRLAPDETGFHVGRIVEVSDIGTRHGYAVGQVVMTDIAIGEDDTLTGKLAVRAKEPQVAKQCEAVLTDFTARYEKSTASSTGIVLIVRNVPVDFFPPFAPNEPCETTPRASESEERRYTGLPDRNFSLSGFRLIGGYHCRQDAGTPPFMPFFTVSEDGHFELSIERPSEGALPRLSLEASDDGGRQWATLSQTTAAAAGASCKRPRVIPGGFATVREDPVDFVFLPVLGRRAAPAPTETRALLNAAEPVGVVDAQSAHVPIHADRVLADFWEQLNLGPQARTFRILAAAPHGFGSPAFDKFMLRHALARRLDAMALQLFRRPLAEVRRGAMLADPAALSDAVWRAFAEHFEAVWPRVTITNNDIHAPPAEIDLVLSVKTKDQVSQELDRQRVMLRHKRDDDTVFWHAPGGEEAVVDFQPQSRWGGKADVIASLAETDIVTVAASPAFSDGAGPTSLSLSMSGAALQSLRPFADMAAEMQRVARRLGRRPWETSVVAMVGRLPDLSGPQSRSLAETRDSAMAHLDAELAEFRRLLAIYDAFDATNTATPRDRLDTHVRSLMSQGMRLGFGAPVRGESVSRQPAPGEPRTLPGWRTERFYLGNGGAKTFLATLGAAIDPRLSYTMDPLFLRAGADRDPDPADTRPEPDREIRGVTTWHFAGAMPDIESEALRAFHTDPAIREAYRQLTGGRGNAPRLSMAVRQLLRNRVESHVHGEVFEEVTVRQTLHEQAMRIAQAGGSSAVIVLTERQIRTPGNVKFVDGMILALRNGELHLVGIGQAKGGPFAARGLEDQFNRDVARFRTQGFSVTLDAKQMQALGRTSPTLDVPPMNAAPALKADFADPRLYIPIVPRDVATTPRAETGADPVARAVNDALRTNVRRSDIDTAGLHRLTDIIFQQNNIRPLQWSERNLDFEEFVDLTRRVAGDQTPDRNALFERWRLGERLHPDSKAWVPVFRRWEAPLLSVDEIVASYAEEFKKARGRAPTAAQLATARENAENGRRYFPDTGRFRDVVLREQVRTSAGGRQSTSFPKTDFVVVDPRNPLWSDFEIRKWAELTHGLSGAEADAFVKRWAEGKEIYDVSRKAWRTIGGREGDTEPSRLDPGFIRAARRNMDMRRIYERGIANNPKGDAAQELADRLIAGARETARLSQEYILVTVHHSPALGRVQVEVIPYVADRNARTSPLSLPQPEQHRAALRQYYRFSRYLAVAEAEPPWLRR